MEPADFTPAWIANLDGSVSVYCGKCREVREVQLERLLRSRWVKRRFAEMTFRCETCKEVGALSISWCDSRGSWTYDFAKGELRDAKLPGYYDHG